MVTSSLIASIHSGEVAKAGVSFSLKADISWHTSSERKDILIKIQSTLILRSYWSSISPQSVHLTSIYLTQVQYHFLYKRHILTLFSTPVYKRPINEPLRQYLLAAHIHVPVYEDWNSYAIMLYTYKSNFKPFEIVIYKNLWAPEVTRNKHTW